MQADVRKTAVRLVPWVDHVGQMARLWSGRTVGSTLYCECKLKSPRFRWRFSPHKQAVLQRQPEALTLPCPGLSKGSNQVIWHTERTSIPCHQNSQRLDSSPTCAPSPPAEAPEIGPRPVSWLSPTVCTGHLDPYLLLATSFLQTLSIHRTSSVPGTG